MKVVERGSGPRVLLIHGFLGSSFSWRHQLEPLARAGWTALAPDLPGFGESLAPGNYSHIAYADACAALLEGGGPAHVVGHSMGGKVALWLAVRRPDLVRSLTLVDAAAWDAPGPVRLLSRFPVALPLVRRLLASRWQDAEQLRRDVTKFYGHELPDEVVQDYWRRYRRAESVAGLLAHVREASGPSVVPHLGQVKAPAHVIWGEQDQVFPVATGRRLAGLLPGARFTVLPGANHFPQELAAEAFNQALLPFLKA